MKHVKLIGVTVALVTVVLLFQTSGSQKLAIATEGAFTSTFGTMSQGVYRIAIVADLDKQSRTQDKKATFKSYLKEGILKRVSADVWDVEWQADHDSELISQHNEAGRGMELSELVIFNNKLYTFDDRTGLVFEISADRKVIPRWVMMEGDGNTGKGQKTEWATVKDNVLYAGSFGKEYVNDKTGAVTSRNNLWISKVSAAGVVTHEDWTRQYNQIRATTNSVHPAYMIIETICWSPVHRKWYILPRRVSQTEYNEAEDEKRGSNIVVTCTEDFGSCEKFSIGKITPERGFSSAKFVPGTDDRIMVALKSEENEKEGTQQTFIAVFDLAGKVLLEETLIGSNKYEGLEFI